MSYLTTILRLIGVITTGHLHHHMVWITTFDGQAWLSAFDATVHVLVTLL